MIYYMATFFERGTKVTHNFYAENKELAYNLAKAKYSGELVRVEEAVIPMEDKFKEFQKSFAKNMKKKKIKPDPLISAIRQLAVMSNAGISINDALYELADATDDKDLKVILFKMADDINSGSNLSKAMNAYREQLGNLSIAMVELGEKTGNLSESLYSLANMLDEIRSNVVKFKKAMNYPRNVMVSMAIAFTVLISFVVPKFKSTFDKLGTDLPLPTRMLMAMEYGINNFAVFIIIGVIIAVFTHKYFMNSSYKYKFFIHKILLRTYLIKNVILFATLNRFTLIFSELIKAGIPIAEALQTSVNMIDSLPLKEKLLSVRLSVEKGSALHTGLKETELFENMIIQMISAGEKGGQLDAMLGKVTDYYKMKFDAIIEGLSGAIEPIMLLIIGIMVTFLALGIFLPMWSMMEAAQGH